MSCGVYKFTNKYNRKVYIGKSTNIEGRYEAHFRVSRNSNILFDRAIVKYGKDGFDFEVLIECPKENLNFWEKFYIRYYCSNITEYGPRYGYNLTSGGNGPEEPWNKGLKGLKGSTPWNKGLTKETDERIAKLSIKGNTPWNKGLTKETDERVAKIAKNTSISNKGKSRSSGEKNPMYGKPSPFKGKHHTEEAKEKNRQAHLGKRRSEESRKKQSEKGKEYYKTHEHPLKGKTPWNKGLTKETDERLLIAGQKEKNTKRNSCLQ